MSETPSLKRAHAWVANPLISEDSKAEIQNLIDKNQLGEIEERFYKNLEFGTGGMRALMGAGSNRLNEYTLRKAVEAISQVINDVVSSARVIIAYDSRHKSFEFAKFAATVFAANKIGVLIYRNPRPVPLCSFAIRHHQCAAGVMITASHNPPQYNGIKVFWADGTQVTAPYDQRIVECFNNISELGEVVYSQELIQWMDGKTEDAYFKAIKSKMLNIDLCREKGRELSIIYTPLHGAAGSSCARILSQLSFDNLTIVPQQAKPDGNFPTVNSPNPEDPQALSMAVQMMKYLKADIALGNDPDGDRVGVAIPDASFKIHYLNGNQIGTLMLHYLCKNLKEQNKMPPHPYFIKTIVTTPLQERVAKFYGVACENTLTGFKWICRRLNEIERKESHRNFIFATEESFGFLNHSFARDKDGISAIALLSEMALFYKTRGMTLLEALEDIYRQFGFSHETLVCIDGKGKEGREKIDRIMERLRKFNADHLLEMPILEIKDYQKAETTGLPASNILAFHFKDGHLFSIRPSGTEPKIKFYIILQGLKEKDASSLAQKFISFIKSDSLGN